MKKPDRPRAILNPRPDRYFHLGIFPPADVVPVKIKGSPAFLHGLKALFVSDVHLRPGVKDAALQALMNQMAMQQADLLLLGGDYAETDEQCDRFFRELARLHFPLGIYASPGNNDPRGTQTLEAMMAQAKAVLLKNRSICLDLPGGRLQIGGCDDYKYGSPVTKGLFSAESADYRILLSHHPILPECECELMLSGHTHGGQFNLLGLTPYSIGFEYKFRLQAVTGLHRFGEMQMAVCNGIGVSKLPLRIGAKPQILLLEFQE